VDHSKHTATVWPFTTEEREDGTVEVYENGRHIAIAYGQDTADRIVRALLSTPSENAANIVQVLPLEPQPDAVTTFATAWGPEKQDYPGGPVYRVGTSTGATLPEQPPATQSSTGDNSRPPFVRTSEQNVRDLIADGWQKVNALGAHDPAGQPWRALLQQLEAHLANRSATGDTTHPLCQSCSVSNNPRNGRCWSCGEKLPSHLNGRSI
jgi:uncharacterized protein YndB with AHSA1/START domain